MSPRPRRAWYRHRNTRWPFLKPPIKTSRSFSSFATTRAIAEDAIELVEIDWAELPAVGQLESALETDARVHEGLESNLAWRTEIAGGDPAVLAGAATTFEQTFSFGRHTGVTLEPRGILASWANEPLLVHASHQMPHQLQLHIAELLSIPLLNVRVVCADVGGGFGL